MKTSQHRLRSLALTSFFFLALAPAAFANSRKLPAGVQPRADAYIKYGHPANGSQYLEIEKNNYIHFREYGAPNSDQPTLFLIPGTTDNLHNWMTLAHILSTQFHIISIDLPGFGLSDPAPLVDFPVGHVKKIHQAIQSLQLQRVTLVGSSLGGLVAWILAAQQDELHSPVPTYNIDRLILLDPVAFRGSIPIWLDLVDDLGGYLIKKRPDLARKITNTRMSRLISKRIFAHPEKVPNVDKIRQRSLDLFFTEGNIDSYIDIFNAEGDYRFPHTKLIPKIKAPTLVVYGAKDKIVPPKQHKLWKKHLRGAQTVLIPDVGHLPHMEAPDITAHLIFNFLRKK